MENGVHGHTAKGFGREENRGIQGNTGDGENESSFDCAFYIVIRSG